VKRLEIHVIGQQGLWMPEVLDDVTVIVLSSLATFACGFNTLAVEALPPWL
jgi:hypothetical protein